MSYLDQITVGSTTYDIKDSSAYSSSNEPPYPVTEVNGRTGAVTVVEDDQTWNGVALAKQTITNTGDDTYVPLASSTSPKNMSFTPVKKTPTANVIAKYDSSSYLYSTTPSANDNSTKVATTAYVDGAISDLPEPMIFKGSLGTGGTISTLPAASSSNVGFTYKVITNGTYASQAAKVGDTFISDGTTWILIPSGDEPSGTVTSVGVSNATDGGLSVSGSPITSSGTISIGHSNVLSSAQTTQAVYPIKIDKNGHISAYGSAVSIPTKVSDLTNDSGFVNSSGAAAAAPVQSVNGQTGAVLLTASQVGALPSDTVVGDPRNIWYGTCSTTASASPKVITLTTSGFTYTPGNMIRVTFTYQNSVTNPMLYINGVSYYMYPNYIPQWQDTETVDFVFGTDNYWRMVNSGLASTTEYGKTLLSNSYSSTATDKAATPYAVKQAYDLAAIKVTAAQASAAAPVQSVNGQTGAVSLTASQVGALPSDTAIPSAAIDIGAIPSVLDSNYYGTTLPAPGVAGRIFFLKV